MCYLFDSFHNLCGLLRYHINTLKKLVEFQIFKAKLNGFSFLFDHMSALFAKEMHVAIVKTSQSLLPSCLGALFMTMLFTKEKLACLIIYRKYGIIRNIGDGKRR